jgi:hypothetical protein
MTFMTQDAPSMLPDGWVLTREAAAAVKMDRNNFRVWLDRHQGIEKRYVGRLCIVQLDQVVAARNADNARKNRMPKELADIIGRE